MPAICLCYEVHEPYRLRHYTVFDMGDNSIYEDFDRNLDIMLYTARVCYLPMNNLLMKLIKRYGNDFKLTLCFSGTALSQMEDYAPDVLKSFQELVATGNVEVACESDPHSFAILYNRAEFVRQVKANCDKIKRIFGIKKCTTYRNAELLYNNDLAACLNEIGIKTVLAEGAENILGWRSPNFVYAPYNLPKMRLLLRNVSLSTDIGRRFDNRNWSEWPLTADKYASWIHSLPDAQVINIFNDYHVFGFRFPADTGIFNFYEALPGAILDNNKNYHFATCSEVSKKNEPVAELDVPNFMSWDDAGRDLSSWLGNDMQNDAINAIYNLAEYVHELNDKEILTAFERLQTVDHFHHMSTKWFTTFAPDRPNPFPSPYDAYIDYMNVVSDLEMRVKAAIQEKEQKAQKGHSKLHAAEKRAVEKKEHEAEKHVLSHAASAKKRSSPKPNQE